MTATDRAGLLAGCADGDTTAMLIYADWLTEYGDPLRGELFRLHAQGGLANGSREARKRYARLRGTVSFLPAGAGAALLTHLRGNGGSPAGLALAFGVLAAHGHPLARTLNELARTVRGPGSAGYPYRGHSTTYTACAIAPHSGGGNRWGAGHGSGVHCVGAYPDAAEALVVALGDLMRHRTPGTDGGPVRVILPNHE